MPRKRKRFVSLIVVLLGVMLLVSAAGAQDEAPGDETGASAPIGLQAVDTTQFPEITLTVTAVDPQRPLQETLPGLQLREADVPVTDFDVEAIRVGVDITFVIDANETISEQDNDDELSRLEKVRRSIIRFATQYMQPQGEDRASVIVPDDANDRGRFLVQDASTPSDVVDGLLAYEPESLGSTPLQSMLQQAVDHAVAAQAANGRFQIIVLYSDGAQLSEQLDFTSLTAAAERANLPVFAAILGARADPNEIANVTRLTDPTGATYVHMPQPDATDPFFQLWQDLGRQVAITYRSAQRSSGQYALTVIQGDTLLTTSYELVLMPPAAGLLLEAGAVIRSGQAPETPLADLEPASLTVPVAVAWPDGLPRKLLAVSLLVNDEVVQTVTDPALDAAGGLLLDWDLTMVGAGSYALAVVVEDELELVTTSEPVTVELVEMRPLAPEPTVAPAATGASPTMVLVETAVDNSALVGTAAGLLLLVIVLLVWQRRLSVRSERVDMSDEIADLIVSGRASRTATGAGESAPQDMIAFLEWLDETRDPIRLEAETTTLGCDVGAANVVIEDDSVSRLHARIKRSGDSYWLYDEGSAAGTYLNFDRLGLGPRILHDQNRVQLGQVRFLFRLVPAIDEYLVSSKASADETPAPDEDWGES